MNDIKPNPAAFMPFLEIIGGSYWTFKIDEWLAQNNCQRSDRRSVEIWLIVTSKV